MTLHSWKHDETWRDIKEAPTDGTLLLLRWPQDSRGFAICRLGYWDGVLWRGHRGDALSEGATSWIPDRSYGRLRGPEVVALRPADRMMKRIEVAADRDGRSISEVYLIFRAIYRGLDPDWVE